jgi:hypothetical protein
LVSRSGSHGVTNSPIVVSVPDWMNAAGAPTPPVTIRSLVAICSSAASRDVKATLTAAVTSTVSGSRA